MHQVNIEDIIIEPLKEERLESLIPFCDINIGTGYYGLEELKLLYEASHREEVVTSFLASHGEKIVGLRLTLAPGFHNQGLVRGLSPDKWKVPAENVAYFKSLFIDEDYRGSGLGGKLSSSSIEALKKAGTEAILCHSWLESPKNSSQRYLKKMGFERVETHPLYWSEIDYDCTRCKKPPCQCTADEMILYL